MDNPFAIRDGLTGRLSETKPYTYLRFDGHHYDPDASALESAKHLSIRFVLSSWDVANSASLRYALERLLTAAEAVPSVVEEKDG